MSLIIVSDLASIARIEAFLLHFYSLDDASVYPSPPLNWLLLTSGRVRRQMKMKRAEERREFPEYWYTRQGDRLVFDSEKD